VAATRLRTHPLSQVVLTSSKLNYGLLGKAIRTIPWFTEYEKRPSRNWWQSDGFV